MPKPERERVAVTKPFRDFFKHWVTTPNIPVKSLGTLVVLATMKWHAEYANASDEKKKRMIEEFETLRSSAEKKGFLQNSRELEVE